MTDSTPWLYVLGVSAYGDLPSAPRAQEAFARVCAHGGHIFGSRRLLSKVGRASGRAVYVAWEKPLSRSLRHIRLCRGNPTIVLATGDPLYYGIAGSILRHVSGKETEIFPAVSVFSLAAARLGWSLQETETLSVHGRPLCCLEPFLHPRARLLILPHDHRTPQRVAEMLCRRGYAEASLHVFAEMGTSNEEHTTSLAESCTRMTRNSFHILAVQCPEASQAGVLSQSPGLPDHVFASDGQITKREVRAVTLSALAPFPRATLWDIGAGCGTVSIEWMRAATHAEAYAIEQDADRCRMILSNAQALGVARLRLVAGAAPSALDGLPAPDAIFIGGGLSKDDLLHTAWQALVPGGRLVANAVTVSSEQLILRWQQEHGGTLTRISVSRVESLGKRQAWRTSMPVLQYAATKST